MSDTEFPQSAPTPEPGMPTPMPMPMPPPAKGSNGLAVAGFVLGLLGLLISWVPLLNIVGIILGVLGAVLAAVGLAKSQKTGAGKGLAIAGLVLGVLAVIVAIVVNVAFVNAVDDAVKESTNSSVEDSGDGATDDSVGTTRDNPAPIGSGIIGDDWTVTINSVTTTDEDSFGDKPGAGKTLLVVNMTATYDGDNKQGETAWASLKFVTADGATIDTSDGSTLFIADDPFDSFKTLYKGASVTGNEMIEVPADGWEDGVLAVSPALFSDDTFVAVK